MDEMIINGNFSKVNSIKELIFSDFEDGFSFNSEIPMGIDVFNKLYIETNENQDRNEEYKKIIKNEFSRSTINEDEKNNY